MKSDLPILNRFLILICVWLKVDLDFWWWREREWVEGLMGHRLWLLIAEGDGFAVGEIFGL